MWNSPLWVYIFFLHLVVLHRDYYFIFAFICTLFLFISFHLICKAKRKRGTDIKGEAFPLLSYFTNATNSIWLYQSKTKSLRLSLDPSCEWQGPSQFKHYLLTHRVHISWELESRMQLWLKPRDSYMECVYLNQCLNCCMVYPSHWHLTWPRIKADFKRTKIWFLLGIF